MFDSRVKNLLIKLVAYTALPLLFCIVIFLTVRSKFLSPADRNSKNLESFEVADNQNLTEIATNLHEKGFIKSVNTIKIIAKFRGIDKKINAGEYELSKSMSPPDILTKLASGKTIQRKVTIPEGTSVYQMGKILEDANIIKKSEFDAAMRDPRLLVKAGIVGETFEGYLFPDTYLFSKPITPEKVIWAMLLEGEDRWKPEYTDKGDEFNMSRYDILTLASIIEKESGNSQENGRISSVFHNRIKEKMKLQSDPTVIYGIKNFNGNLTKIDLETPTPYNTYIINGLPPGPICNPGESAIKAALYPDTTTYLYFVGDGTGKHVFSTTLAEHNKWVNIFQRGKGQPPAADSALKIQDPVATKEAGTN